MRTLAELAAVLNTAANDFLEESADSSMEFSEFLLRNFGLDLGYLPVFDNEDWNNPWGVWSWDETSVLVPTYAAPGDDQWELVPAEDYEKGG